MRKLTAKQKKLIDTYINSQLNKENTWEREISLFKVGLTFLDIHSLPSELYAQIEAINDSEILYQEIDRYMEDQCQKIHYKIN